MFGLRSKDKDGEAPAKKPTKFMTNSLEVYKLLNHKCDGSCPRHVHRMGGAEQKTRRYPRRSSVELYSEAR